MRGCGGRAWTAVAVDVALAMEMWWTEHLEEGTPLSSSIDLRRL